MPSTPFHSRIFHDELARREVDPARRRWIFVPYDQLTHQVGPLARLDPEDAGIVVVESVARGRRRPYHRQKLALVLANLRHFALEEAARGVAVRHLVTPGSYADALRAFLDDQPPGFAGIQVMEPAERELRVQLAPLVREGLLEVVPHEGWLTTEEDFRSGAGPRPPWRMDAFYRQVRQRTGLLMDGGSPVGGKYSFDAENRKPWKGEPPAAVPPTFEENPVKDEVLELVDALFGDHPGTLDGASLPCTGEDAETLWAWALDACLPHFGPYEDAMSTASSTLFHTRISGLMNLHRLLPSRVVADVLALEVGLASREGFVRQVLGWREFVRHVHRATDGFRVLPASGKGDPVRPPERDGHAAPSILGADTPLPEAYWGTAPSGLHCLDHVVEEVWREGYGHHITRLMILSNLATLLDVDPRALTDWFWVAYVDAYDWVVEPNVLGMGTFAVGEIMTTKPYVSGTPYIRKMSDYCDACALDPATTCPISELYWAFLERHRDVLQGNRRLALPLASAAKRGEERQGVDAAVHAYVQERLGAGEAVTPQGVRAARRIG